MDFNFVEFRYHYQPQGDEESGPQDTTTRIGGDCNATDLSRAFFHFAASMGYAQGSVLSGMAAIVSEYGDGDEA